MAKKEATIPQAVPALKVNQWLPAWDGFHYSPNEQQRKPEAGFFICSIKANHLKSLTGVYRRSIKDKTPRALDPNVQRGHEEERSGKIKEYVQHGLPWCEMGKSSRESPNAADLQKPGWLPTAILVNILPPGSKRNGVTIGKDDLISVDGESGICSIKMPSSFTGTGWTPSTIFPLEVIDGQHRLWAFEDYDPGDNFELPVVAFYGLDHGWQAYLFWSVNVTPKKINRSLAFDLYPLLRQQTWLDRFEGHSIYRETRSQELVEALWSHEESPWYQRINMLGETKEHREYKGSAVTQAAWVRSLMATFVKAWEGRGTKIGGLFGAQSGSDELFLPWNRAMQAAFLIFAMRQLRDQTREAKTSWAINLRSLSTPNLFNDDDPAFYGNYSLLTTDQGIRGILFVINDLCYAIGNELELTEWRWDQVYNSSKSKKLAATEEGAVSAALETIQDTKAAKFLEDLAKALTKYDWRTSSTPQLPEEVRTQQSVFRGSSGYKEMRRRLLSHLGEEHGLVGKAAQIVTSALGY